MLLCQSISNMCNWKPAIYFSFALNPKEKNKHIYKANSGSPQKKLTAHLHSLLMKTRHGNGYTHSEKTFILFPKNANYLKSS